MIKMKINLNRKIKIRPSNQNLIKEIKQSIRNLRQFSQEKLNEIIKNFEENDHVSKTILVNILNHAS